MLGKTIYILSIIQKYKTNLISRVFFSLFLFIFLSIYFPNHIPLTISLSIITVFLFSFLFILRQLLRLNSFYKVLQTLSLLSGIKEKEEIFVCLPQMDVSMFMCVCVSLCVFKNFDYVYTRPISFGSKATFH